MNDQIIRTGGCLCGAVRYEVHGEPYIAGLCHCTICRKITGSAFSATANWCADQFHLTGQVQTYDRRQFCPQCGSRLFYLFDGGVEVFLGTLDHAPYEIKPMLEVWTIRREPWLHVVQGAVSHDRDPPKP